MPDEGAQVLTQYPHAVESHPVRDEPHRTGVTTAQSPGKPYRGRSVSANSTRMNAATVMNTAPATMSMTGVARPNQR